MILEHDIIPGVKGLIFDLDGTLVNSMPYHLYCWKKACKHFGADIDQNFLRMHTGSPGRIIAEEAIKKNHLEDKVTIEDVMKLKFDIFDKVQHNIKAIKPVADIVKKYYGILPMAVGTGGHSGVVEKSLAYAGLDKYFDIIVTASDIQHFKPHPETFLKCAEKMGVAPQDIEVFEDGDLGIEAAKRAGMYVADVKSWYNSDWEQIPSMPISWLSD